MPSSKKITPKKTGKPVKSAARKEKSESKATVAEDIKPDPVPSTSESKRDKKRRRQQESELDTSETKPVSKKAKKSETKEIKSEESQEPEPEFDNDAHQPLDDDSSELSFSDGEAVEDMQDENEVDEFAEQKLEIALDPVTVDEMKEKIQQLPKETTVDSSRGTIYIGHIPFGFFELQMKDFFSQFGDVTRIRLSRSKKTGQSKGYAFVEFANKEVARIVADTMNNYLMYGRRLKVEYVEPDKLHPNVWKGANRKFRVIKWAEKHRDQYNKYRTPAEIEKKRKQLQKQQEIKKKKLAEMGIDYDFPSIV